MVSVRPIKNSGKDMKAFIEFGYSLYKGNDCYIPDLYVDMVNSFNPKKNAGLEFSNVQLFLAYDADNKIVGRVAAIINNRANETWNVRNVRFGWFDFVDDVEVSKALLNAVAEWGRERGMSSIQGPMGITDMDKEGMLIEGFDRLGTMNTYYNYAYYPKHMETLGYEKEADWVELRIELPLDIPEKFLKVSELTMQRYKMHVKKLTRKDLKQNGYGQKIFDLINEAYAPLFGYSKMSQKQIEQYIKTYLPMVDLRMLTLVEEDETNDLICVGLSMASMARALQKSGGKLFPFGWFHLLKAMKFKHEEGVELLLIAARPDYQGRGVTSLLFTDLIPIYKEMGFKWAETNVILETNIKNLSQWTYVNPKLVKRRRCWRKSLV
ncbi:MAG: N-acetyltransferase [Prevotellaceae bacterium]|nr:N-acetyltransferase [Candidatus Minthosoma caballi]